MPLSRHLYSLDEVQAALFYTTSRSDSQEALFWSHELILSGCIAETISTLFQSWLWNTGPTRLQWLINAWQTLATDELTEHDILLSTYQLTRIKYQDRDNSLWNILVLTIQNPYEMPDTITRKMPAVNYLSNDDKELYFIGAMFQGKARSAFWISQFIEIERVWDILNWFSTNVYGQFKEKYNLCLKALQNYEQLLGYKSDTYDLITRCMAILIMCIPAKKVEESFSSIDTKMENIEDLSNHIGFKKYRIYQIPKACLYGTTLRGRLNWSQNNLSQLYNVEHHLIGCPFWNEVLDTYADIDTGKIIWKSDVKMEEFYEKYFPDDIPDEWLKKDQLQSHGDGILSPTEKISIMKYSRNFMSKISKFAWGTSKRTNKYLENIEISECTPEKMIELYVAPLELSAETLKKLKPVHKIKL